MYRHLLPSVRVGQGGQLYLNKENLPVSGGTAATQAAPPAGSFEVYTSNCGTVVQVLAGGQLTVGGDNAHPATALFGKNSLLDVQSGGQLTVSAGAVLRFMRDATLVLRRGSSLLLNGQLVVEAGAFICVEDPASVVIGSAGLLGVDNNALRGVRPALYNNAALNLGGLSCQYYPACQASLYLDVQEAQQRPAGGGAKTLPGDTLTSPGFNDCAHLATITAQGAGLGSNFAWTVNGQPKTSLASRPDAIRLVLNAGAVYDVQVTVTSTCDGSQLTSLAQVQGTFPNCRVGAGAVAMYPNPATDMLDFGPETAGPDTGAYTVRLYDGQGSLRWQGNSTASRLHVACAGLPRGLYGVVITQGDTVVRRTLSLE